MKSLWIPVLLLFCLISLDLLSQPVQLEVAGSLKVDSMELDSSSNRVVVRQADGTLAERDLATLSTFPIIPVMESDLSIAINPLDLIVSGHYAYIVSQGNFGSGSFQVVDISDPGSPAMIAEITGINSPSIQVAGEVAYAINASGNELNIIDISNPRDPGIRESFSLSTEATSIHINGIYAAVTCPDENEVKFINVSDPGSPFYIDSVSVGTGPHSVFMSGSYAYVLDNNTLYSLDLRILDEGPVRDNINLGGTPSDLFVSGNYAYVIDKNENNLKIIDISNASSDLSLVKTLILDGSPTDIIVAGNYAFIVCQNGELKIINVENYSQPLIVSQVDIGGHISAIYNSGRYIYGLDQSSNSLKILDISPSDFTALEARSLEVGNIQVHNDLIAQGRLNVRGGLTVGEGGIISEGGLGVNGMTQIKGGQMGENNGTTAALMIARSGSRKMLLDDNEIDVTSGDLFIQSNSSNDVILSTGGGNVGIRTTNPTAALDVNGSVKFTGVGNLAPLNTASPLYIESDGTIYKNVTFSDRRLKDNIRPMSDVLHKLESVYGYRFTYLSDQSDTYDVGVIAQELEESFPELVYTASGEGYKAVRYDKLTAVLLQAIKELEDKVQNLESQVSKLNANH